MSTLVTDHKAEGQGWLLEQFASSPKLQGWLGAYLDEIQGMETALQPVLAARDIDTATGHRLDGLGQIVNVERDGRDDDAFRLRIRAEVAILQSTGTEFDLIKVLQLLTAKPDKDMAFDEYFPKTVYIRPRNYTVPGTSADQLEILTLLRRAAPAGTEVHYVYSLDETSDQNMFRFSDTADTTESGAAYGTESGTLCGAD